MNSKQFKSLTEEFTYDDDFGEFNAPSPSDEEVGRPEDATSLTGLVAAELPPSERHTLLFFRGHLPRSTIDTKNVRLRDCRLPPL